MLIYFAVLAFVAGAVHLAERAPNAVERRVLYAGALLILVLFGGVRNATVGTDAVYYDMIFRRTTELSAALEQQTEPGVPLLGWVSKQVYNDYIVLFTMVTAVVALGFLIGIRRLSINPAMSAFVLLTSGIFYFSFNGFRQGLAIAIVFPALEAIWHRRLWLFLLCVAVACFFHYTALVVLPLYFLVPRKNDFRYNVLMISLVVLAVALFSVALVLAGRLEPRYLLYGAPGGKARGFVYSAFLLAMGVFFLVYKSRVRQYRPVYDSLLNVYLLGLVVVVVAAIKGTDPNGVLRLSAYFTVSQVLLWPIVFANIESSSIRTAVRTGFVLLFLVYHALTLQAFSQLVPYTLNPLLKDWLASWLG